MNRDLLHTNEPTFKEAIASLAEGVQPIKIICFASRLSMTQASSSFHTDTECKSFHYDLLIVRKEKDKRKESEILQHVERVRTESLTINVITHSDYAVQKALAQNNPFFTKLFKDGSIVYSNEESVILETNSLNSDNNSDGDLKRKNEWTRWFELSERFLSSGSDALGNGWHDIGVFLLHQAVEHGCIAFLRAHMGYKPSTHSIKRLLALAMTVEPKVAEIFPCNTTDESELLSHLRKSYSDVRYKDRYHVPPHVAFTLLERVSEFRDLIEATYRENFETGENEYSLKVKPNGEEV